MSNKEQAIQKKEMTQSERFVNMVTREFGSSVGEVALTNFQKRLAQNYFVAADNALRMAEEKRAKKRQNQDPLPVVWQNVNMEKLARDVVSFARVGFDPSQKNHISLMPFKNNTLNKYDMVFIEGYRGIELKATKYGLDIPDMVTVEIVYSNDRFKPRKKDINNPYEGYEFEIVNPFDRGTIIGGFYYHCFSNAPEKNHLVIMTLKDIEKRKPAYASAEFWGGEKDKWENGKKVGTERIEGWYEKMVYKTIYRAAYGDITIDSQKIDDDYLRLKQMENDFAEAEAREEISQNANREFIDITAEAVSENNNPEQSTAEQESAEPKGNQEEIPFDDGEEPKVPPQANKDRGF